MAEELAQHYEPLKTEFREITRPLGSTGERLPVLGFGSAPIGISGYQDANFVQSLSEKESLNAVAAAIDHGIRFFDTAPAYANKVATNGWSTDRASERMLGCVLSKYPRDKFYLATKNMFDRMDASGIRESLEESLRLLQTDYVDLYQVHGIIAKPYRADNWRDFVTDEVLDAFQSLQREGKVRHIGISGYREGALCAVIESRLFDVVMPQFNYFYRGAEWELVKLADQYNTAVIPMRPITGGLMQKLLQEIDPGNTLQADPIYLSMKYILSFNCVSCIPVGMRTVQEVEHNIRLIERIEEQLQLSR